MDNYRIFVETVKLLASSPDIQLASIPELACRPDEIAFCLEDIMPLMKDYVRDGIITKKVFSKMEEMDNLFISFKKKDWSETALTYSPKWEKIRGIANSVLDLIGEKLTPPNMFWITDIF